MVIRNETPETTVKTVPPIIAQHEIVVMLDDIVGCFHSINGHRPAGGFLKIVMFTFDDLVYVEDTGIQKALREIDTKDLSLAMKSANEEVREKVFKNMSERAREMIKEEIDFMGPVRVRQVEEAQQKIVSIVRRLEDSGELIIQGRGSGGEDQLVV